VFSVRYGEISGKEIINVNTGERLGVLGQTDLQIDKETGKINVLLIPTFSWFGLKRNGHQLEVPWECIKKIGKDIILIEFDE